MRSRSFTIPALFLLPFLAVTLFVIQLGLVLSDLPSAKLMQDIICKHYYNVTLDDLLPEEDCRIEPVQQELNTISMGILISVTVASALVAFPLGIVADKFGRIPVLGIAILGMLLSQGFAMYVCWQWKKIPLKAIWAMAAPLLIGGGRSVAEAMVFTIISDVVPGSKCATWFQCIVGAVLSAQLLAPVLSGVLVKSSIWLPLWLSLGLVFLGGLVLVIFVPETLPARKAKEALSQEPETSARSTRQTLKLLFSKPAVLLLPGAVLAIPLASVQSDLLLRLMPIQFHWRLDRSALLISLRSLTTLVTLFLVLPGITYVYYKISNEPASYRDGMLARISAILFLFGSLCLLMIGNEGLIITGLVVSALGSGLPTLCRAMLVSLLREEGTGSMFGMLAVGETLGFLVCELSMGLLFGAGLRSWIGLPFCLGIALTLGIGIATWFVPLPGRKKDRGGLEHQE
ncbi:Fc.00g098070.m01.CDS01 [Cosmosporella sp. VM-42]